MLWIATVAPILIAMGAWRGARRLLTFGGCAFAAAAAAMQLGPMLHDQVIAATGYDTWAGTGLSCAIVYVAVAAFAAGVIVRLFPERPIAARGLGFRLRGAAVGSVAAGLVVWGTLGNLPDVALKTLPEPASDAVFDLRRPFELLRACRTFGALTPEEADHLAGRPEIIAMLDNRAMEKLLRTPGVLRKVSRAAEGDWGALGALAADEAVKSAMHDPQFLARVGQFDVCALADEIERRRAAGDSPRTAVGNEPQLPAFARDPEFIAHVEREWSDLPTDVATPRAATAAIPAPGDRALAATAYWHNVGTVLEWCDGRSTTARLMPKLVKPLLPTSPPPAEAEPQTSSRK